MEKKVTLKDISNLSGVSISTVSRVLSGAKGNFASKEKCDLIWKCVKDLGYKPNLNAKNLVLGTENFNSGNKQIGCFYNSTIDIKTDPFFSCIGIGIQEEVQKQGYNMAFAVPLYALSYSQVYNYICKHPAEGVIITGNIQDDVLDLIKQHYTNIVHLGVNYRDYGFDEVICNSYNAALCGLNHLIELGHKKIGFIGYTNSNSISDSKYLDYRFKAYSDLVENGKIISCKNSVISTRLYTTSSYETVGKYLSEVDRDDLPSAFFCSNDATAFGALKALKECNISVPNDVAIIGFDNVEMSNFVSPTLTTIGVPRKKLGIQGVKILIDKIQSKRDYSVKVDIPFELVIRESSKKYI